MGGCGGGGGDSGTTSKQKVSAVVERCPRILPPGISENLQFHVLGNTIYLGHSTILAFKVAQSLTGYSKLIGHLFI